MIFGPKQLENDIDVLS